jgi:hypothetical protein
MTQQELPAWPNSKDFRPISPASAGTEFFALEYERARAEAAMARLVVAVDALEYARKHMAAATKDPVVGGGIHGRVFNALQAIGDLPPSSQERG